MFWPRAGSSPRVKTARQKICLGSEVGEGEPESLLIFTKITTEGARGGGKDGEKADPWSPHPNATALVSPLEGDNHCKMRSAIGSRELKRD